MKDIIFLTISGRTMGFIISKEIIKELGFKQNDMVEIEIFKEFEGNRSFIITRPLRKIGSSKGITIRANLIQKLGWKAGDSLQVDIRTPD